jgi:ferredoxin
MAAYPQLIVYYFSGTGNSENVAYWLTNVAKENGMNTHTVNIGRTNRLAIEKPDPEAIIAFISPIHGFNYPPAMLHFIMRFPKGGNTVLLMNTRAGMLIGKWITPGLTGVAFYLSAFILKLKGYSMKSMFPVDLPSNWISVHPGLNERTVKYLHERNQEKVYRFAQKVFSGGRDFRGVYEIVQDTLIAPISLGYYFMGRFMFAKTFFASADCNGCDLCIKACPVKAIRKVDGRPFWTFNCESCMHCMSNCPKKAIETGHGAILAFSLLFSFLLSGLFYKYFAQTFFDIEHTFAGFIVESALFIALLAVWYRIIHFAMRFRFVERLIVYTSLTKYKFWGRRYKALRNNKIQE